MIVLDTHVLLWAVDQQRKLGRKAKALIDRSWPSGQLATSAMTFWEIGLLQSWRRIDLPSSVEKWREELLTAGLGELPVDGVIAMRALQLVGLPDDPIDRLITATTLEHHATLITADERLLSWQHPLPRQDARE